MKAFYKDSFLSGRSAAEIMAFMRSVTVHACDQSKGRRKAEFRGYIWENSFMVCRNLNYRNSFNAVARVSLKENTAGTEVDLRIGMNMIVFVFMCIWCSGVLFFGLEMAYHLATERGAIGWIPVVVLLLFLSMAWLLFRFVFYESCKTLKKRMREILE